MYVDVHVDDGELKGLTPMTYVIDGSDNGLLEQLIEYADDDADLLELAMIILEQMVQPSAAAGTIMDLERECELHVLPRLAHTA